MARLDLVAGIQIDRHELQKIRFEQRQPGQSVLILAGWMDEAIFMQRFIQFSIAHQCACQEHVIAALQKMIIFRGILQGKLLPGVRLRRSDRRCFFGNFASRKISPVLIGHRRLDRDSARSR